MSARPPDPVRFHLLGRTVTADVCDSLMPALLFPFRDLSSLRHDYPLVLSDEAPYVHSLTDLTNRALQEMAEPGAVGERLRQRVLRTEEGVRRMVDEGRRGSLTELWGLAAARTPFDADGAEADTADELATVRDELPVDGEVVGCDGGVAAVVLEHVWNLLHEEASRVGGRRVDELALRLSAILDADAARSAEGRSATKLRTSIGGRHRSAFDFEMWSALLRAGTTEGTIPNTRRRRVAAVRSVLLAQRFFNSEVCTNPEGPYPFRFRSCVAAAEAYRTHLPAMVELVKALAIAELEVENRYREADHDPFFRQFGAHSLTPEDVNRFPSYLVCTSDRELLGDDRSLLLDLLGSDAPIKVLVQVSDVLGEPPDARASPVPVGRQLGLMAMGLGTGYVVQTASSNLHRVAWRLRDGVNFPGPALFTVFTGSNDDVPTLPPYLLAAAAMQSRAFPAFSFDPGAGPDWAERFRIESNPFAEADWPEGLLAYEDDELQRHSETAAFTVFDFAAVDRRYVGQFAVAPPESWDDRMEPAARLIEREQDAAGEAVPYILMTSGDDHLHRVVVGHRLIAIARRFREAWHNLQELAGIHNSHAEALLEAARATWEQEHELVLAERGDEATVAADQGAAAPVASGDETSTDGDAQRPRDESDRPEAHDGPFIETARCTTCDECTDLNPRMFAYNDDKQAYIADLHAGTFREMVEAAEACQVAIIHPGAPWDPSEPGLDELVERAAAFA